MSDMTDLQRQIMRTARDYPRASQKEIADRCDCSSSYVSNVLNQYDSVNAFNADLNTMPGVDTLQTSTNMGSPVWLEDTEPIVEDEELDEAVAEGMQIIGASLKKGYQGLKVLIRKIRS
jgi:transcriptional regulator with XRE-family HTH domain